MTNRVAPTTLLSVLRSNKGVRTEMTDGEWEQVTKALPREQADSAFAEWKAMNASTENPLRDEDIRRDIIYAADPTHLVRYLVRAAR